MNSGKARVAAFVAVVVVAATAASAYAVREYRRYQREHSAAPSVDRTTVDSIETGPRIVFRHTGIDNKTGLVAMVTLDDPSGPRAFTDVPCDRVYAVPGEASCLQTERGVVTKYVAQQLDATWEVADQAPLPGLPSRTRLSPDGTLVASTSFVTGHSYMTAGFSTATEVRKVGADGNVDSGYGNLERFQLEIDGKNVAPTDRNFWGVTFLDDNAFLATVETGGKTYLAEGDLRDKSIGTIAENAECPSVSPDRDRVAFKIDRDPDTDGKQWGLAVLDLDTGERTTLDGAPDGVDDQVEWLDDDTLLFGLPREDEPGITDVWSLDTEPGAEPQLLIEQAWSPSVVRSSASALEGAS